MLTLEEVQELMLDKFSGILFNQEDHEYVLDGIILTSVTKNIELYHSHFDSYYAAESKYKSELKKNPDTTITAAYYRERWDLIKKEASARGSRVHLYAETYPCLEEPRDSKEEAVIEGYKYMIDELGYQIAFMEFVVFDEDYKMAGMVDLLLYNPKTGNLVIADWKTNDAHLFEYYKGKNMKGLFKEYSDTKYNHYSIQLSNYQYMIEKRTGLKIENKIILWLNDNPKKKSGDYQYQRVNAEYKTNKLRVYKTRDLADKISKDLLSRKEDINNNIKYTTNSITKFKEKNKRSVGFNTSNKKPNKNDKLLSDLSIDLSSFLNL